MNTELTRRLFMKSIAATAVMAAGTSCTLNAKSQGRKNKPNILLLFSDQHQADCMGYENHPDVITPNLDRLAQSGTVFTRAYCLDGVCVPSRMSMMTGLYPRHLGILHNPDSSQVASEVVSLQSMLKDNGYYTAAFGKRHLSRAGDQGWDLHRSHIANESPGNSYVEWVAEQGYADQFTHDRDAEFGTKYPTADLGTRVSVLPEDKTMEAFTAQETIKLIRQQKDMDKPFFCWSSFYRPHQPYNALKRYLSLYDYSKWGEGTKKGSAIKKPSSLYQPTETLPPMLQSWRNGANKVWNLNKAYEHEDIFRLYIASYYALVTEIDHHIGSIIKALKEEGLFENTIIIYASDHGDFVGRHGMVEKCAMGHNVYEDTLRIPMIVSKPGLVRSGQTCDDLVGLFDIYPTVLDLVGIDPPKTKHPIEAVSLAPTLTEGKSSGRKYIVSENWSQAGVITDKYKLGIWLDPAEYPKGKSYDDFRKFGDMLFDRQKDPDEVNNMIDDPEYAKIQKQLREYFDEFCKNVPATGKNESNRQKKS